MKENNSHERVLIVAPVGRDASVMTDLLAQRGFEARTCATPAECCEQMNSSPGALLLTEEALELPGAPDLLQALTAQPAWSEVPLIILTSGGQSQRARLLDLAVEAAGSVTLLERPIGTTTFLRSLEVALNSRRRQYQVRDLL
jgi:DNA-binding NtrC family response regulator